MSNARLSLKQTADWCRSLGTSLRAGLSLLDALRSIARRGTPRIRAISQELIDEIESGSDLYKAMRACGDTFPPLLLAMTKVATYTGRFPETLRRLEDYFRFQLTLRRQFLGRITWPAIQLIAAIFIIAALIYILGIIGDMNKSSPVQILGLSGSGGAMIWLGGWLLLLVGIFAGYKLSRKLFAHSGIVDRLLIRIPVAGPCLQSLCLARLCFALQMTVDSGMPIKEAIRLSLEATDNGAYTTLKEDAVRQIAEGQSLLATFESYDVFPDEFLEVLHTAEESGSVPDAMGRLSATYSEVAEHRLAVLNVVAGWVVWLIVAAIIIFMVFRIFITAYWQPMQDAMQGI